MICFLMTINKPTLIVNKEIALNNLKRIKRKAEKYHLTFRPHFKTHQSVEVGNWFKELNIHSIAVSSLDMAHYFANHGWNDITLAVPVNILQIDLINQISKNCDLQLLVESIETLDFLDLHLLAKKQKIWIKLDTGYHRTGILTSELNKIEKIIKSIHKSTRMTFMGFLIHDGHTYQTSSKREVLKIYQNTIKQIHKLKDILLKKGVAENFKISYGDTPSCSIVEDLSEIDELRCGNFIFYDLMQNFFGSCLESDIALVMAAPVIAKSPDRKEIVLYGGAAHLSKERLTDQNQNLLYGKIVFLNKNGWSKSLRDTYLSKISQEHGILKTTDEYLKSINRGDIIGILPVHSCLAVNLMKHYYTLDGNLIKTMNC